MKKQIQALLVSLLVSLVCIGCGGVKAELNMGDSSGDVSTNDEDVTEIVINHPVFTEYDEVLGEENIKNEMNYYYDWNLEYENDNIEIAFADYVYVKSGFPPINSQMIGDKIVNDRYVVWEGNGYAVGVLESEDGESTNIYIKFTDKELKNKVEALMEEKNKRVEVIAKERNDRYELFKEKLETVNNLDRIPNIVKEYPLYAGCYVSYGKFNEGEVSESESSYRIKELDIEEISGLVDILLESEYITLDEYELLDEDEVREVLDFDNMDSLLLFELVNDFEEIRDKSTYLVGITYFKDGSIRGYTDDVNDSGEYVSYRVENDKLKEYLNPLKEEIEEEIEEGVEEEVEHE